MNERQVRSRPPFAARSKQWSPRRNRPEPQNYQNARGNYDRYLALADRRPKMVIRLPRKTTTSTPNTISDRCPQPQKTARLTKAFKCAALGNESSPAMWAMHR